MTDSSIRVHREPAPRALVVGLGISGTASALALHRAGWEPVIIERAPQRRRGGYFMAIFGAGRYAAQDLGVGDRLANHRSPEPTTYTIDRTGHRRPGLGFGDLPINPYLTMRDDVEEAIYDTLREQAPDVSIRFGTTPRAISQDADGVDVTLTGPDGTTTERFDLVVGADGIHSQVRRLVFAPDSEAIDRMGTMICAFALTDDLPTLPQGMGARLLEPNRAFHVFPFDDRPSTVLFSYGTDDVKAEKRVPVAARLREVYGHDAELGPVLEAAITQLEDGRPALFDAVEQVHLPSWHRGRVVLVGDSAWCPSLYSGMGATSGLAGANLLGLRLAEHPGDVSAALDEWERTLRPHIREYQKMGVDARSFFTPATGQELRAGERRMRLQTAPITSWVFARLLPLLPVMRKREVHLV